MGLNTVTMGHWCSNCVNKTERKLFEWLKGEYSQVTRQFKQEWCKNKTYLPFDFCLEDRKIIIELDGKQHFRQVSNWETPEHTQKRDLYKQDCALEHGYSVIRIIQMDVFEDRYDWQTRLKNTIENIGECEVEYLCEKNEYDNFLSLDQSNDDNP